MIREGYYKTRGEYRVRVDRVTFTAFGVLYGSGYFVWDRDTGVYCHKDDHPELGESADLIVSSWQHERYAQEEIASSMSGRLHKTRCSLTDEEWMMLLDRDANGLPPAHAEPLRRELFSIVLYGRKLAPWNAQPYIQAYRALAQHTALEKYPLLEKLTNEIMCSLQASCE